MNKGWFTVGVLVGWQAYEGTLHSYLAPIFEGIRSAARAYGCNLLIACGVRQATDDALSAIRPAWPIPSAETSFVPVGPWNTDGLIVVAPLLSAARSRDVRQIIAASHPVVFVGDGEGEPSVTADNEGGIHQAVAHLVGHGHRRIAFIAGCGDDKGDSWSRQRAYQTALREHGLEADPQLIVHGFQTFNGGLAAAGQLLNAAVPFTAVVASNDESAYGAMAAVRAAGLRVPGDVAIVGFDDRLETLAQPVPLTSVRIPAFKMGYQALDLLRRRMAGEAAPSVNVPARLIVRESCGCPPEWVARADRDVAETLVGAGPQVAQQLVQAMSKAVVGEMHDVPQDEVEGLCERLVTAFVSSLEQGDDVPFRAALRQVLQRVESAGDEVYAWHDAVSVLRGGADGLLGRDPPSRHRQAEDLLHQARVAINWSGQRQRTQYAVQRSIVDERVGWMTAQLLTALDEDRLFETLQGHLPGIGIRSAEVALFQAQEEDDVAWSVLSASPADPAVPRRFATRQFPPPGLYPADQPFDLALLPLTIWGKEAGFVAFQSADLSLCATIARQVAAALRSAQLYRQAVEGQKLAEEGRQLAEEGKRLAEEANRLKSRFLSSVSHELRTPLNVIVGLTEMMLDAQGETEQAAPGDRRDLEQLHASAQYLDGLVRDVLDLARSDVGKLQLTCEPLDVVEVLNAVAVIAEQMARNKELDWRIEVPARLPPVWGDRTRLRQVVLNLVSNAVKFTARGEVSLQAAVDPSGQLVTVRISDTGLGIPAAELGTVFDEFTQSERTAARGYGGLGMGLAICKRLVEMHGGKIEAHSSGEEEAGSTFLFSLPVMSQAAEDPAREAEAAPEKKVLLLVARTGDEGQLQEYLTGNGFEVIVQEYQTGESATWFSRLLAAQAGAIVLDMQLAATQGWEVLRVLKENPATRDVPVLFYTLTPEKGSGAMLELDYMRKPVGTAELAHTLARQGLADNKEGGKTILVVDDEPSILSMHARIVEEHLPSCRVLKAQNGREALELIRAEHPDLVLLDLLMPELDGFGVLEAMQKLDTMRDIPVVVLTGQSLTAEDMERLNRGVAVVLGKGMFSAQETLEYVKAALSRQQRLRSETLHLVRRAMAYIHEHHAEPISRQDMARYIGASERHLTRCFRQEMGMAPMTYLNRYRIRQAKTLLASGEKTITEVALEVGFSSPTYFSTLFHQEVGESPSAYRSARRSPARSQRGRKKRE